MSPRQPKLDAWEYMDLAMRDPTLSFMDILSRDDVAFVYLEYMLVIMEMQSHLMEQGYSDSVSILIADSITARGEQYYERALERKVVDEERYFRGTTMPDLLMEYFELKYGEEVQHYVDVNFGEIVY